MKTVLCVDLDETLLAGINQYYIPRFPSSFCEFFSGNAIQLCEENLHRVIRQMIEKDLPIGTIQEFFEAEFFKEFASNLDENRKKVDDYYRNEYPKLRHLTKSKTDAVPFFTQAVERGYDIVLATDPIYPKEAILQRLDWAGLSDFLPHIRLLTSSEEFHFCKPNPAYFFEIQARFGWLEDTKFVMVGDSLKKDIYPAIKAGMSPYWVSSELLPKELEGYCGNGSLGGVFSWLNEKDTHLQEGNTFPDIDFFAQLYSTAAVLDHLYRTASEDVLNHHPAEGEWSFVEILCHLRDADGDVNYPRFKEAFQNANPFLPSIDTHAWVTVRNYRQEDAQQALVGFFQKRIEFVQLLKGFHGDWWQKTVRHSVFGPTDLAELLTFITTHDRIHIRQAFTTIDSALENARSVSTNAR